MILRVKSWISDHQFTMLVVSALLVTGILTMLSLWLYYVTGAAKLDLSRPGYEEVRDKVKDSDDSTKPFPATGALNDEAVKDFNDRYQAIMERLDKMNSYDEAAMSDENLGIVAEQPVVTEPINNE